MLIYTWLERKEPLKKKKVHQIFRVGCKHIKTFISSPLLSCLWHVGKKEKLYHFPNSFSFYLPHNLYNRSIVVCLKVKSFTLFFFSLFFFFCFFSNFNFVEQHHWCWARVFLIIGARVSFRDFLYLFFGLFRFHGFGLDSNHIRLMVNWSRFALATIILSMFIYIDWASDFCSCTLGELPSF